MAWSASLGSQRIGLEESLFAVGKGGQRERWRLRGGGGGSCNRRAHRQTQTQTDRHRHTLAHKHTDTHLHTYLHTHTHTCTHTLAQTDMGKLPPASWKRGLSLWKLPIDMPHDGLASKVEEGRVVLVSSKHLGHDTQVNAPCMRLFDNPWFLLLAQRRKKRAGRVQKTKAEKSKKEKGEGH